MEASDAPYDRGSELAPSGYYLASRVPIHGLVVPRMRTCSRRPCGLLILAVYFRFRSLFFFFRFPLRIASLCYTYLRDTKLSIPRIVDSPPHAFSFRTRLNAFTRY